MGLFGGFELQSVNCEMKDAKGNGKKKITWHTTFGDIEVQERLFIIPGKQFRPFSHSAGVSNRGCFLPLQRVIVDFGAFPSVWQSS